MEASLRSEGGGGPVAHPQAAGTLSRQGLGWRSEWVQASREACRGPRLPALYKARPSLGSRPAPCLLAKFRPLHGPEGPGNLLGRNGPADSLTHKGRLGGLSSSPGTPRPELQPQGPL